MNAKTLLLSATAAAITLSSCSKLGALSADNFNVVPNPMETVGGKVPVTINGMFPEKYMKKKAVVAVIPELRYGNKQSVQGSAAVFQGEKVQGNDQTISYLVGGHYTMKSNFTYEQAMQKSDLWLTFDAKMGNKSVTIPPVKVATGIIATSELFRRTVADAQACIAPDSFQRVKEQKYDATVKFLIQQANLRQSELQNNSVKEFVNLLKRINADREGLNLTNVEVSAYASPDGGVKLNDKVASIRQDNTEKYVKQQLKNTGIDSYVDAKYTAQDWDGFQELVAASNIQDKDVILRVLSMYKDPEERERQIKNMSAGFRELADGILPQLRRARMTINYETIGRDDEQIQAQLKSDPSKLSVEEMLYAATLTDNPDEQKEIYKQTTQLYPSDGRAYNNIATIEYAKGNYDVAQAYINDAQRLGNVPETYANLGLMALKDGKVSEAEQLIAKATGANDLEVALGNLHLAQGNYQQAEQDFERVFSNSAALSQIMNKDYAQADVTLMHAKPSNAMTDYLRAILSARQGNYATARESLKSAVAKDPTLATYAANDLELQNINK